MKICPQELKDSTLDEEIKKLKWVKQCEQNRLGMIILDFNKQLHPGLRLNQSENQQPIRTSPQTYMDDVDAAITKEQSKDLTRKEKSHIQSHLFIGDDEHAYKI